jgi:alpha-1,2-mannosyltransferase
MIKARRLKAAFEALHDRIVSRRHVCIRCPQAAAFAMLASSVAIYAVLWGVVLHEPFHVAEPHLRSFDLDVYRTAAAAMLHGRRLYAIRLYRRMRFTYPPFTALLLVPNRWLGPAIDHALIAAVNIAMLFAIIGLSLRLTPRPSRRATSAGAIGPRGIGAPGNGPRGIGAPGNGPRGIGARGTTTAGWTAAALLTGLVLWSEPVIAAVGYGQIDLAVTLALVWDLARPRHARGRGLGVGLAAGLKLTPLLFIPFLLLAGRRRAGLTAAVTFLATVAVGFLVLPADSVQFWGGAVFESSRAGDVAAPINQSLLAMFARAAHTTDVSPAWTALIAALGVAGLLVAVRAARRGDEGVGFAVCALTSLLVSPISWDHHWVLAIPAIVALLAWARRRRLRSVAVVVGALAATGFMYMPELVPARYGLHLGLVRQILISPYVILGFVVVCVVAVAGERRGAPGGPGAGVSQRSGLARYRRSVARAGRSRRA